MFTRKNLSQPQQKQAIDHLHHMMDILEKLRLDHVADSLVEKGTELLTTLTDKVEQRGDGATFVVHSLSFGALVVSNVVVGAVQLAFTPVVILAQAAETAFEASTTRLIRRGYPPVGVDLGPGSSSSDPDKTVADHVDVPPTQADLAKEAERELIREAKAQGYTGEKCAKGHYTTEYEGEALMCTTCTPRASA